MKTSVYIMLAAISSFGLISCNDDSGKPSGLNDFLTTNSNPVLLSTTQNNNFNSWNFDDSTNFTTVTTNDYSDWRIYVSDGGGSLTQTIFGDCNRWDGVLNGKQTEPFTSRLETIVKDDFNEWKYQSNKTYFIRTAIKDDFNCLKFFDSNNNYISEIKTTTRDDFNKWRFVDTDGGLADPILGLDDPAMGLYFIAVIITVSWYY